MGPSPGSEIRNEDTEFGRRVGSAGNACGMNRRLLCTTTCRRTASRKSICSRFGFDHGRAAVREMARRPDIWRIPRHYLTISKMGMLLVGRIFRWALAWEPQRRFYCQGWVWMTAGEIVEVYRRSFGTQKLEHDAVPKAN